MKPKPFSGGVTLGAPKQEPIDVSSGQDPSAGSEPVSFTVPGFEWSNPPPLKKWRKLQSFKYLGKIPPPPEQGAQGAAAGNPTGGATSSTRANYTSGERREASHRFLEVIAMLKQLAEEMKIARWSAVAPARSIEMRDDHPVWLFPATLLNERNRPAPCAWSWLDRSTGARRAALVCEIVVEGRSVLWLETEIRTSEGGHRSVLFTIDGRLDVNETIIQLLVIGARSKGVWRDEAIESVPGIAAAHTWTHKYFSDETGKRRLSVGSAYAVIAKTANLQSCPVSSQHPVADKTGTDEE